MKKTALITLCILAASCQQNALPDGAENKENINGGTLRVDLVLPDASGTKVAGSAARELSVNTLQIFVFKDSGTSDHSLNIRETDKWVSDGSTSVTLNTYVGNKRVWALVNAPRLAFANEQELMTHYSRLEENSATNLLMTGETTVEVAEFNAAASVGTITPAAITVRHLGSRITVRNVKVNFSGTSLEGCYFDVKELYVLNAVNSISLDGTCRTVSELGSSACWYNLEAWNPSIPSAAQAILGDRGNLNISIGPTQGTQDLNRFFYVYPNVSTSENDNTESTESARFTRLVLHGYIRGAAGRNLGDNMAHGEESYYCFDIPKTNDSSITLERNHSYDIENITITMPGGESDSPADRPKFGKVSATITVTDWGEHTQLTYEL